MASLLATAGELTLVKAVLISVIMVSFAKVTTVATVPRVDEYPPVVPWVGFAAKAMGAFAWVARPSVELCQTAAFSRPLPWEELLSLRGAPLLSRQLVVIAIKVSTLALVSLLVVAVGVVTLAEELGCASPQPFPSQAASQLLVPIIMQ